MKKQNIKNHIFELNYKTNARRNLSDTEIYFRKRIKLQNY